MQTNSLKFWRLPLLKHLISHVITLKNKLLARMDDMTVYLQVEYTIFTPTDVILLQNKYSMNVALILIDLSLLLLIFQSRLFLLCVNKSVDWLVGFSRASQECLSSGI